jgi:hypothetical protein
MADEKSEKDYQVFKITYDLENKHEGKRVAIELKK